MFYIPQKRFDTIAWKKDRISRFQMSDDLIGRKILINKDTAEVKALLGEPFRTNQTTWTYDMGQGGGGFGFMFHTLSLTFHEAKVIAADHHKVSD